jgi:hypothetical protein
MTERRQTGPLAQPRPIEQVSQRAVLDGRVQMLAEERPDCPLGSQSPHDEKEWNGTHADPLLPERARYECARSTAAVGPTRVPFHGRKNKRAWSDH